ncbi:MAG: gliding motility-associated C-terminal domain-containing protein [Bacteroidota bacterium]
MRRLFFILTIFGCGQLAAQGFYNNGAIVSISTATILSVPDSIVNHGTLINNGQIIIAGAWINSGTYDAGSGEVTFDSDLDQVINHNAQSIEKLVISGGGKKEFLADIFVQSALTLNDGVLVSKNGARIVMDQSVTITGGSDQSHINGPVERKGAGDWTYPIGNGTTYLPVTISGVTDASAFGIITLHEITNEVLTVDTSLNEISKKRYWELASSGDALKSASIIFTLADEELDGDITVGRSNTSTGPYSDLHHDSPTFKYYAFATQKVETDHKITIYNAVSVGNDGKNDLFYINNIEFYKSNTVVIHNRWGDRVFESTGYDNNQTAFADCRRMEVSFRPERIFIPSI